MKPSPQPQAHRFRLADNRTPNHPPLGNSRSRDRLLDVAPSPPPRGAPLTTTPTPALWTTVEAFSEPIGDDSPCAGWPDYRWPGGVGGGTDPLPLPPGAASLQLSANSSPARNPPQPSPPLQPIKSAPPVSVLTPCSPQNPAPRTATHSAPSPSATLHDRDARHPSFRTIYIERLEPTPSDSEAAPTSNPLHQTRTNSQTAPLPGIFWK